jgi:hypothetical protein
VPNKEKKDLKKGREVAIIAVLAEGGWVVEPFPIAAKSLVFSFMYTWSVAK